DYLFYCEDSDLCLRMLLGGYRGTYIPRARAYHVGGGTTGGESELARFQGLRNGLVTRLQDIPRPVLLRLLLEVMVDELHQYNVARGAGFVRTWLRAYCSFLKLLPGTLRKRWRIQRRRQISAAEFEAFLITDYPLPSKWGRLVGLRPADA